MIELNRNYSSPRVSNELERLQERASYRRDRHRQQTQALNGLHGVVSSASASPFLRLRQLPPRYLLHSVVALVVPVALALSALPTQQHAGHTHATAVAEGGLVGLGPISLDGEQAVPAVGDPPLLDDGALPVPISLTSRSETLAPLIVPATIAGDLVKLRNGPGLDYDEMGRVTGGTHIQVLARHGEWLQVREGDGASVYWVAGELVNLPEAMLYTLSEVPSEVIPPPPPPKIGTVIEDNVNLRDGPGTNYVPMTKMERTQTLTLIEQYQGWYLVEYGENFGWVSSDLLTIGPGVTNRVPVANTIPDPNPALVGYIADNATNLRKGPGSAYDRVTSLGADTKVDLLARHKDWYKVQLGDGTKAWVFSDLLKVTPMVRRRVAHTNDIPALPVRNQVARSRSGGNSASAAPVNIPASGDVAGFAAQFVGYRYVWGGSSPSRGFDCSGLTSYVYRQFGVGLPHSAAAQFSSRYGAIIGSMGSLAPGDLVFFAGTTGRGGITHVAIYIGGGRIVHAMTPAYGVQISNLYTAYWQNHFAGGLRPYR
jgi:cell wall-associated NlpC family hydrolase